MKGIKMILGALAAASLLFSVNASAQENNNRDENGKVVRGAYETNKAFDNTFIGIGAGINSVIGTIGDFSTWGKIGLGVDLNFGKWWTPAVGMRFGYHGLWNSPKIAFDAMGGANQQAAGNANNGDQKLGFHYIHGDILWNISNSIGGYKETRFWDFVPYFQMGLLDVSQSINPFDGQNLEYAAGPGIINELRLGNRVNAIIDLSVLLGKRSAYTADGAGMLMLFPSASLGLQFNLGKTNFDRHSSITPVVIPVPFTTDQYNALADKVAALEDENNKLRDKIASLEDELAPFKNLVDGLTYLYENGTFTAVDVKPGAPLTVYFDCGSTKISARERAHLDFFIENVVKDNEDIQLEVTGYADKQTGSGRRNQYLSEQRAKVVKDILVNAGAKEENVSAEGLGDKVQLFDGMEKNRVARIVVK